MGERRVVDDSQLIAMRIVTRFTTADQFVGAFHRLCTDTTCFIPTMDGRAVGVETCFSIRLADGTPMLRGYCVVREVWATVESPFRRPGVLLGIRRLTRESVAVFHQIQMMREAVPTPVPQDDTVPHAPSAEALADGAATIEMPPLFLDTVGDCATFEDDDASAVPTEEIEDRSSTEPTRWTYPTPQGRPPLATLLGVAPMPRPAPAPFTVRPSLRTGRQVQQRRPRRAVATWWSRLTSWLRPRRAREASRELSR
jgi:hypothetical protein